MQKIKNTINLILEYTMLKTGVARQGFLTFFSSPKPGLNSRKELVISFYCWLCFALFHEFFGHPTNSVLNFHHLR